MVYRWVTMSKLDKFKNCEPSISSCRVFCVLSEKIISLKSKQQNISYGCSKSITDYYMYTMCMTSTVELQSNEHQRSELSG